MGRFVELSANLFECFPPFFQTYVNNAAWLQSNINITWFHVDHTIWHVSKVTCTSPFSIQKISISDSFLWLPQLLLQLEQSKTYVYNLSRAINYSDVIFIFNLNPSNNLTLPENCLQLPPQSKTNLLLDILSYSRSDMALF